MQSELNDVDEIELTEGAPEPPPRPVEELKQLVGAASVTDIVVGEEPADETASLLDVHEATRQQLEWKPKFHAQNSDGSLRAEVTRLEARALLAAGASLKH